MKEVESTADTRIKRGTLPDKIDRLDPKERRGLIVVITGNGKGKTTSALGMALRACGHGMRVCIIQFMKGDLYAGEWDGIAGRSNALCAVSRARRSLIESKHLRSSTSLVVIAEK